MIRTLRSNRARAVALSVGAVFAIERPAHAQPVAQGFVVDTFEPSERGSDWFVMDSLDLRGTVRPAIGVVTDYVAPPLTSRAVPPEKVVVDMWTLHAGAAVNLIDRFRLAVDVPFVLSTNGRAQTLAGTQFPAPSGGGVGDIRFGADFRLGGTNGEEFTAVLGARFWAPTGKQAAYAGDGEWKFDNHLLVAGEVGSFAYAARFAYEYRYRSVDFIDATIGGPQFAYGLAAGAKLANKRVTVGPELYGSTAIDHAFTGRATPLEVLLGAHVGLAYGIRASGGIGTGLTNAYGSPDVRILFGLEFLLPYSNDRDGDGIPDAEDACPDQKGKASKDPMKNGCPEDVPPPDRDHDGVIDRDDACIDVPGVKTSDPKTNGCPPDKDGDGVYDADDACPDVPGVKTDDPKTNGCPPDTDGDGVLDPDDACPNEPGIKTNDPKTNGCPDQDRDKDGIPNTEDACPDEPGPRDPDPKRNGCPKAFIRAGKIEILDQVKFKTGSAQILPGKDSDEVLQAVFTILSQHPEIKKVRVEGHTDNVGGAAYNKKLSKDRAASVVKWLVAHAIEPSRLTSQGFGPDKPIADNKTEEGRRNNRRVEFHIESRTPAEPPPAQ
jgi:outer membrane protein OmpA-like peptidoglycan-associated protein